MPLTEVQIAILQILAAHRNPESYVAGALPLNRVSFRYSGDIDIFHDRAERVAVAAMDDAKTITEAGYRLVWLRQLPTIYTAEVSRDGVSTRLEWVVDSDYRYFPIVPDDVFGYVLHAVDLAMNKVMAAAGRREVRDIVDLVTIHQHILPLGAVIWAAVEKSPGFTPEGIIDEIRRNAHYPAADWQSLMTSEPLDPKVISTRLQEILQEAESFVLRMPTEKVGLLFLQEGRVVQPDPDHLENYLSHAGARRGHWPSSSELESAMLAHYCNGSLYPSP